MASLKVQHCVLTTTLRQYGPNPTSDLLGVDYFYTVPADTEFPKRVGKIELFVRFFATGVGPSKLNILVFRTRGYQDEIVYRTSVSVAFPETPDPVVMDRGFKLTNVVLPSEGEYVVRLFQRVKRTWQTRSSWRVIAREYFVVRRAS